MKILEVKKRDDTVRPFNEEKITVAVKKAMDASEEGSLAEAQDIMGKVVDILEEIKARDSKYIPSIEGIQNVVEEVLMSSNFHKAAKAYILYREEKAKQRKLNVFSLRINLKPYEYPYLYEYVDAIRHSYWIHTEFKFDGRYPGFQGPSYRPPNGMPSEKQCWPSHRLKSP